MHVSEITGLCFLDKNQKTFQFHKSSAKLLSMYAYSCFDKVCRKKCTRQSRKVLWVVLSSLFFKEI